MRRIDSEELVRLRALPLYIQSLIAIAQHPKLTVRSSAACAVLAHFAIALEPVKRELYAAGLIEYVVLRLDPDGHTTYLHGFAALLHAIIHDSTIMKMAALEAKVARHSLDALFVRQGRSMVPIQEAMLKILLELAKSPPHIRSQLDGADLDLETLRITTAPWCRVREQAEEVLALLSDE